MALVILASPSKVSGQLIDPDQSVGQRPELLKDVGVDQKLNDSVPLDLTFRDEHGKTVELAQYFGSKPVILTLAYYNCPMLCTQVLNGLDRGLKQLPMSIGQDFTVVTVSIDPTERPVLAEAKQALYAGMYAQLKFVLEDKSLIDELARGAGVWTYYYVGLKKPTAENPVGEAKRLFMIPFDALPGILVFAKARHLKRCPCVFFPLDPCYRRRPPFQNRLRPGPCDWSRVLNKRPALSRCPGWSSPGACSACGS